MDINGINFHSLTRDSNIVNVEQMPAAEDDWNTLFINYAAEAWHEMRRAWRGDQSVAPQRKLREPMIRWSTSKTDLPLLEDPLDGPVPLSSPQFQTGYGGGFRMMVQFLVEVWKDDLKD